MHMNPTIAVLMATYNGEKYLREQLDSILSQSYQNIKIYICDDSSNDSTSKILKTYQKKFPEKISYVINKSNLGVVKNFEQLIKNCQEPYIALADQDDIWKVNKLELSLKKLQTIENSGPAMVHSDLTMIDESGKLLKSSFFNFRKIKLSQDKSINKIISHNGVMGCTVLFNQALKKQLLPFPEKLDVHDYWIALVNEIIGKRYTIEEPLVQYRIHENNISNNIKKLQHKNGFLSKFFNADCLPFIGLHREYITDELMERFGENLNTKERNTIHAFKDYLEQRKNPILIFYNLVKYNLIREDFSYRLKILIKLIQKICK